MTSYRAAPLLLLFMFACEQCNEEDGGLTQRGSVANAPVGQGTLRTEDGVEVIMPQRREDPPPRPDHGNLVREPDSPDPHGGNFSLEEAVEGLPTDGQLVAEFNTTFGTFFCDLYAEKTPRTVANFIGLARGTRAWWDARQAEWRTAPAFQDTQIFRVLPGFLIQGGDYLDDGTGTVGYNLPAEPHPELSHDRPGQLCVATTGANEGGAQWFITDGPAPR
ncbi:MAG: peptidylprolyl isomerase, partial [Myxococcota bacterium]